MEVCIRSNVFFIGQYNLFGSNKYSKTNLPIIAHYLFTLELQCVVLVIRLNLFHKSQQLLNWFRAAHWIRNPPHMFHGSHCDYAAPRAPILPYFFMLLHAYSVECVRGAATKCANAHPESPSFQASSLSSATDTIANARIFNATHLCECNGCDIWCGAACIGSAAHLEGEPDTARP